MQRVLGTISPDAPVSTGTALKTVLLMAAAANHRACVSGWGISFNGSTPNDARILVELVYYTDDGTMTAIAAKKRNPSDNETLQTAGAFNATVEPAEDAILHQYYVDPEWGYTELLDDENEIVVPGGAFFGIRTTAGADVSCTPFINYSE